MMKYKTAAITLMTLFVTVFLQAQTPQDVLQRSLDKMNLGKKIAGDMIVSIFFGNDLQQSDRGDIAMHGYKVSFDLPKYRILANESTCWLIDKEGEQIEISHLEDQFLFKHPRAILDSLAAGAYLYDFEPAQPEHLASMHYLQFKPRDIGDEVAKVRLVLIKDLELPSELVVMTKDGYRYQIAFENLVWDAPIDPKVFELSEEDYPDFERYDVRLD